MIGIFDSGIGGLTVTKEIFKQLPEYKVLYLGDTARTPYGNRSQELIYEFTEQAVAYLFKQGCELIVVACNTASAEALRKLQQEWLPNNYPNRRVLGVIRPVVEEAAKVSESKRTGVAGTKATVKSRAYEKELKKIDSGIEVFQEACPLLVPLVEEGWKNKMITGKIIRNYLRPIKLRRIDTLILGCTHYPMLMHYFKSIAGKRINVLDTSAIVTEKLVDYLKRHPEIESKLEKGSNHRFMVTDLNDTVVENASRWMGRNLELEKVDIDK